MLSCSVLPNNGQQFTRTDETLKVNHDSYNVVSNLNTGFAALLIQGVRNALVVRIYFHGVFTHELSLLQV